MGTHFSRPETKLSLDKEEKEMMMHLSSPHNFTRGWVADTSGLVLASVSMMEAAIYSQPPAILRLMELEKEVKVLPHQP